MAVSTSTEAWNSGTLVGAVGTCAEVLTELAAGADSTCTLENREFLMAWGIYFDSTNSTASAGAMWYTTKTW